MPKVTVERDPRPPIKRVIIELTAAEAENLTYYESNQNGFYTAMSNLVDALKKGLKDA